MTDGEKEKARSFAVVARDGVIEVWIESGVALLKVDHLRDHEVLVQAINKASALGARKGTLFTGEIVNDREAAKWLKRADRQTTWLGGKVTRLADGEEGPQLRIDWEEFPHVTE